MKNNIIDIKKLKNVTRKTKNNEIVIIAQCPACAAAGYDLNGRNHLIIYPDHRFACAVNQGEQGAEHRKQILDLVGTTEASPPPKRPARPRPINPIPTKITYIKLKPRPQHEAEATEAA